MQDILINWSPQETRVALVEYGSVQELHVERTLERGLVGNVYLGKVSRVLPGMQSAFIDVGLERTAFLHVADIVARYGAGVHRRLLVKPGLTGLWQIGGRADLSWDESIRLDLRYVENWTLALDALIIVKTVRAVLAGSGAY